MNSPQPAVPALALRTFGIVSLRRNGDSELLTVLAQPKRVGLLCYLARARGFVRRDRLLTLFWPESDEAHARSSLRQAIHFLRRTLGEQAVMSRGDDEVAIDGELVWCDAVAFERAIEEGRAEDALALYQGDFLPGFAVDGAPEFDQWLDLERDRLRRRAILNAWALAERHDQAGDADRAADLGRAALALAPTDDALLRKLMLLLERNHDASGALQEYLRYERLLRADLDLDPAPEARRLAGEIAARRKATSDTGDALEIASAPTPPLRVDRTPAHTSRARRFWLPATALVITGMIFWWPATSAGDDARRVVVVPFENATGDSALAPLATRIADEVTRGIALSGFAEAMPPANGRGASPEEVARAVHARMVVSGRYFASGDTIVVEAHTTALAGPGREIGVGRVHGPRSQLDSLSARAADRILGAVAVELDRPLGGPPLQAEGVRAPTYEAYRAYREAAVLFVDMDYEHAIPAYQRVLQLDSTFYRAAVELAWSQLNGGNPAAAESTFRSVMPHKAELDPESRVDFEGGVAAIYGTWARGYRMMRDVPGCGTFCNDDIANMALAQRRVHEAWRLLDAAPTTEYLVGVERWSGLHVLRANVLFALGRHADELREARRARELFPDLPRIVQLEGRALAALGRTVEAGAVVETLVRQRRGPALAMDVIDVAAARDSAAARTLYQRALELLSQWKDLSHDEIVASARCLIALGQYERARAQMEAAHLARPSEPLALLYLGTAAAGMGDRVAAIAAERELASLGVTPVERARNVMRRAMIAAALGDRDRAVQLIKAAYAAGYPYGPALLYAPQFAGLRGYPPFRELVDPA